MGRLLAAVGMLVWSASSQTAAFGAESSGSACAGDAAGALQPDLLYGERLGFEVRRNGDTIGYHDTRFSMENGQLQARSETRIKIKLLFVTAYSFSYEGLSVWCNGAMTGFSARVNDNGKIKDVSAMLDGGQYHVSGVNGKMSVEAPLHANEHWNRAILKDGRVMNGINGRLATVKVVDLGDDMVDVKGGRIPARHYSYSGDLQTEVWYDSAGRWVKMRLVTKKDQSVIEYFCTTCGPENKLASRYKNPQLLN